MKWRSQPPTPNINGYGNFSQQSGSATRFYFRRYDQVTPRFYIVSKREPVAFSEVWQVQSRPYAPQLSDGQHLSFQLRANPVITKTNDKGKPQRHDVVMDAKKRLA
jgi:CRISPR system Cascade subunit CasE